jgi:hypothetical protein
MRIGVLCVGIVLGACIGALASLSDGIGLTLVMISIGAVAGAAIGGAIARISTGRQASDESEESYGQGTCPEDRMRNFWRDNGKLVSFSGPPDPQGTRHDFDRERL